MVFLFFFIMECTYLLYLSLSLHSIFMFNLILYFFFTFVLGKNLHMYTKREQILAVDIQKEREHIRITCPCNEDPLTPHFYIVKLGFTGVFIFLLFLL